MNNLIRLFLLLLVPPILVMCTVKPTKEKKAEMVVSGKLDLPKGTFQLIENNALLEKEVIDSLLSPDGTFNFKVNPNYPSSLYSLVFYDEARIKHEFLFKTKRLYNGGPWLSQYFMPDDSVSIVADLKPFNPKGFTLPADLKLITLQKPIKAGKQTEALFNISYDFSEPTTDTRFNELQETVKKYPFSYYLINEIEKTHRNFSSIQLKTLLASFNNEIKQSDLFVEFEKSIPLRNTNKIASTELEDPSGIVSKLDFSHSKINMVVLWASWCGPCRMEIPDLKKIHQKFKGNPDFSLVSISLDSKKEDWLTALNKLEAASFTPEFTS